MSVQSRSFCCRRTHYPIFLCMLIILLLLLPTACRSNVKGSPGIKYTPLRGSDLKVSTPAEQGLNPALVGKLYANAAQLDSSNHGDSAQGSSWNTETPQKTLFAFL